MKRRIQNMFDEHLDLMVCMFAQLFYDVDIFLYDNAITTWIEDEAKRGLLASIVDFRWILMLNGSLMESFSFLKHHDYFML